MTATGSLGLRRNLEFTGLVLLCCFIPPPAAAWPSLQLDTAESLQTPVSDMVYSAVDGKVYVSAPAQGGSISNQLTPVDPLTGELGVGIPVGNNPGKLAASDDGQFVYVVCGDGNRVDRVSVASGTVSLSFTLGTTGFGPVKATDIAVMPGLPGTIAIVCGDDVSFHEVRIYDGSVMRPLTAPCNGLLIEFGVPGTILYGFDNLSTSRTFYRMSVVANGVSVEASQDSSPLEVGGDMAYGDGFLFSTSKGILDPATMQMRFPFYGSSGFAYYAPVTVDSVARRVNYVLPKSSYFENLRLQIFSLDSFLPVGEISLPSPPGYFTGNLIRWGADGLAYRANTNQIYFLRTSFLPSAPVTDLEVLQDFVPAGVSNALLRCCAVNNGPNPAQNTKLTVRFEGGVALGSIGTSVGSFQVVSNQVICDFGVQPVNTTNAVLVEFAQPPTNTVLATAIVTSISLDTNTGNNTLMAMISTPAASGTGTVFSVTLPLVDMVADPARGGIFLALDRQMTDLGNGVVYFDPSTGQFTHSTFIGSDLRKLAMSSNGQALYAASAGKLTKLDPATLTIQTNFPLAQNYAASDLSVSPDDSNLVAVWHVTQPDRLGSVFSVGLGVYQDAGLPSSTEIGPTGRFRQVVAAGSNGGIRVFDSWDGLEILGYDLSNGALTNEFAVAFPFLNFAGEIKPFGNRFYSPYGPVYDLATDRVLGTFNVPGVEGWPNTSSGAPLVEPDVGNGRVFFLRYTGSEVKLHSFDALRYRILGSMVVPGVSTTPSRLIRWGRDGLAFKTDKLFLVRSSLVPSGAESDLSARLLGGANPGRQGQGEAYSLTISNEGPETATGIVATMAFSAGGTISGFTSSQGSTISSNLSVSWDAGSLAAGASAAATCTFTPGAGGLLQVVASVSGQCRDANPANDSDMHLEVVTNTAWLSQINLLTLPIKQVISDSSRSNLIASLHELGGVAANSIMKLNPQSGVITGPFFVGSSPNQLAISADGSKVFVGLDGASSVQELDATTLQPTLSFSVSNGLRADLMDVVPGTTQQLLVYRSGAGLSVFDQGAERSNKVGNVSTFVFDDLTGDAFGCDRSFSGVPLYRLAIDANGVTVAQTLPSALQQSQSDLKAANGRLYYDRGLVVSAALGNEAGRYPVTPFTARVQPAPDRQLVYFLTGLLGKWSLRAFHDISVQPAGMRTIPGLNGSPSRLARWGATGLAFATSADQLFLLHDMFTSDSPMVDVAIHHLSAPRTALPGKPAAYVCTITNRSASPAIATVVTQAFGFAGSFQQVQASVGTIQTNGTEIVWMVGDLAANAPAQISVQLLPTGIQTMTNRTTVASATLDPAPANNLAQAVTSVRNYSTNAFVTALNLAAADLVYDVSTKLLWASVTNNESGGTLVPIDPIEGVVGPGIEVGSEVTRLGVAGDGVNLYALLPLAGGIARVNTTNSQWNLFTSLGFNPSFGFHPPLDIAVSPTNPSRIAVSYYSSASSSSNFVATVDAGVLLPNIGRYSARADVLEYDAAADQVYGFNNTSSGFQLSTFAETNAGFVYKTNATGLISGFNSDIKRGGGRLYGSTGQIVDPRTRILITNLAASMTATAVEPAVADNRIYFATKTPSTIRALNLTNFARLGTNTLSGVSGDVRSLIRWGVDGLAMHTTGGQVLLLRSSMIPVTPGQDSDADGMPDDWESGYGLNPYDPADGELDLDGDGFANRNEYRAGTNPYDASSVLRIKQARKLGTNLVISFTTVTNRVYSLDSCGTLAIGQNWSTIVAGIIGSGGEVTNFLALAPTNTFLRLRTQP